MPRHLPLLCLAACLAAAAAPAHALRIATWNLEWLVSPATAHAARHDCDAGRRARLPCDVVRRLSRDSADHTRLASYARALRADVVAVQEVENTAVARQLFRGYGACMADGGGVQHAGFVVAPGIPYRCEADVNELSLQGRTRAGALLTLWPDTPQAITLLSVHLKSGCPREPAGSTRAACRMLAEQMTQLAHWLDDWPPGSRVVVLGDFNRAGIDAADPLWQGLLAHPLLPLQDAAREVAFANCHDGQPFWQAIDHILLSASLATAMRRDSFTRHPYRNADAIDYRLPDHCPSSIELLP